MKNKKRIRISKGECIKFWVKVKSVGKPDENGEQTLVLTNITDKEQEVAEQLEVENGCDDLDIWHHDFQGRVLYREVSK